LFAQFARLGSIFQNFDDKDEEDACEENLHVVFNRVAFFGKRSTVASTNGRRHGEGSGTAMARGAKGMHRWQKRKKPTTPDRTGRL